MRRRWCVCMVCTLTRVSCTWQADAAASGIAVSEVCICFPAIDSIGIEIVSASLLLSQLLSDRFGMVVAGTIDTFATIHSRLRRNCTRISDLASATAIASIYICVATKFNKVATSFISQW